MSRSSSKVEKLEVTLRDKDAELARTRQAHTAEVTCLLDELRELRASYELKIREYEELMDIKINLDQEIATYRALLHEEETRWAGQVGGAVGDQVGRAIAIAMLCIVPLEEEKNPLSLVDVEI